MEKSLIKKIIKESYLIARDAPEWKRTCPFCGAVDVVGDFGKTGEDEWHICGNCFANWLERDYKDARYIELKHLNHGHLPPVQAGGPLIVPCSFGERPMIMAFNGQEMRDWYPEKKTDRQPEDPDNLGVTVKDGRVMVSSRDVARVFGKEHYNVLRDIKSLDCSDDFNALNFEVILQSVDLGHGRTRQDPAYLMTRDGFVFLVMGYTGHKAAQFKEAYINRFNEMEKALMKADQLALVAEVKEEAPAVAAPETRAKVRVRPDFYTPEEAAWHLGFSGFRAFYRGMEMMGLVEKTPNGSGKWRYRPTARAERDGILRLYTDERGRTRTVVTMGGMEDLRKMVWR